MAIVKILSSKGSFGAVKYNEERINKGEAKLLLAKNFNSNYLSYQEYLQLWSEKNKRIKDPQFHVSISAKGKELSEDDLLKIGEQWMKRMGYGENPYLIYFHNNTNNNHIHIISSRIDKNGNKIDHNFENLRALQCLKQCMDETPEAKYRNTIANLLKFSFSTKYQFFELCKKAGFAVYENNDKIVLRKGSSYINLNLELIQFCQKRYHKDCSLKEKKRIQGLIYKYAAQLNHDNFIKLMREQFGLEFIFYGKDNTINGYTIIDYKNKQVYKGSEIFGVKKLSELLDIQQNNIDVIDTILNNIFKKNRFITSDELKTQLFNDYNIKLNHRELIDITTGETKSISDKLFNRLNYNDRLQYICNLYRPNKESHILLLSHLFKVRVDDIKSQMQSSSTFKDEFDRQYYLNILELCDKNFNEKQRILAEYGLSVCVDDGVMYILDSINHRIIDNNQLNYQIDKWIENVDSDSEQETLFNIEDTLGGAVDDILGLIYAGRGASGNSKPKKRRRQK